MRSAKTMVGEKIPVLRVTRNSFTFLGWCPSEPVRDLEKNKNNKDTEKKGLSPSSSKN